MSYQKLFCPDADFSLSSFPSPSPLKILKKKEEPPPQKKEEDSLRKRKPSERKKKGRIPSTTSSSPSSPHFLFPYSTHKCPVFSGCKGMKRVGKREERRGLNWYDVLIFSVCSLYFCRGRGGLGDKRWRERRKKRTLKKKPQSPLIIFYSILQKLFSANGMIVCCNHTATYSNSSHLCDFKILLYLFHAF